MSEPGLRLRQRAWLDLLAVLAVVAAVFAAAAAFEVSERLYPVTRRFEWAKADESLLATLELALGMLWFAWRRYCEAARVAQAEHAARQQADRALGAEAAKAIRLAQRARQLGRLPGAATDRARWHQRPRPLQRPLGAAAAWRRSQARKAATGGRLAWRAG